jgi:DNA modification methylase
VRVLRHHVSALSRAASALLLGAVPDGGVGPSAPAGMAGAVSVRLFHGDCRAVLPTLPEASVHCVVTSPPYWGLRDYGVEGQLGLEPTPEAYVAAMVGVFRDVRRVLRDDGTLWLNMGDSYGAGGGNYFAGLPKAATACDGAPRSVANTARARGDLGERELSTGLKPKDLVGMPWKLAFALQADGWYLRADVIWSKPNPMPESVTDRPTKAHEYVFLLTKSARYFYDADAVREPAAESVIERAAYAVGGTKLYNPRNGDGARRSFGDYAAGRNLRSVWTIPSAPFPDAHFATFPPALASRCIQAGTSERGCCAACGAPWARTTEVVWSGNDTPTQADNWRQDNGNTMQAVRETTGWQPSCACDAAVMPCTVLDPFGGSGTVGAVAEGLGRHSVLVELNPAYVAMAERRTAQLGLFTQADACATRARASIV